VGDVRLGLLKMEVRGFVGGVDALGMESRFVGVDGRGIRDLSRSMIVPRTDPVREMPGTLDDET
jgi:hypothetical protein